jgi:hypothetical protein
MQIEVIYRDYSVEQVATDRLDDLIAEGTIIAFRRASGLVLIGMDPIRQASTPYHGPERRTGGPAARLNA